jgi:cytochrome oxidase Cu insertion factor (SCO1/SenC/PrrC family)
MAEPEHEAGAVSALAQKGKQSGWLRSSVLWWVCGLTLIIGVSVGVVALQGVYTPSYTLQDDLRPFGTVPDFALHERSGRLVTRDDLREKIWIAGFIFTRCVHECPLVSNRMARLQETFAAQTELRLVSITVDPEHDTPEVLSRYAEGFGAHPQRWLFLTGEKMAIYRLTREGFRLGVVDPNEAQQSSAVPRPSWRIWQALPVLAPVVAWAHHDMHQPDKTRQAILHSARLVLVDRQGRIRQYYDSKDEEAMRRLQPHVKRLLTEH